MKKFTKLFLSCAAMAAVTAAVATTAMAAPSLTATYDETNTNGTLALKYNDVTLTGETTVLVSTEALTANITDDKILYIDQAAAGAFGTEENGARVVGLRKPEAPAAQDGEAAAYLPDNTYYVYVGYKPENGDFAILNTTFTVGEVAGEEITIGDINNDGELDGKDATGILLKGVGKSGATTGQAGKRFKVGADEIIHGDINNDGELDGKDATGVLLKGVGKSGATTGQAGNKVTAVAVD